LKSSFAALVLVLLAATPAAAQAPNSKPQPLPQPPAIEAPRDVPYPGLLTLSIDATDLNRRIYRSHETVPVTKPGPMTLLYAQWLPGNHSPSGPLYDLAGLKITTGGKPVIWTRDTANVFAFHIVVPAGATSLDIDADYLTPVDPSQGGVSMTPDMLRLYWFNAALYPAGYFTRQIQIQAKVRLPDGFDYATALETASSFGGVVTFKPESYETLGDSPLIAGRYFKKIDLDPGGRSRVTLNIAGDSPEKLVIKPEVLEEHKELVRQMDLLYGARHYNHYDFLFTLSDKLAGAGLEHQRSSDDGTTANYFTKWDTEFTFRDTLAHEYNHSWNGKYRRPADLWTPNFNTPMRDSLLWVYEGQTQYWGNVIAARAGMATRQQALDSLAAIAAQYDQGQPGRDWRPLQDTTNDPIIAQRRAIPWNTFQRSEDYYREGQLIWLDVDTLIRERSKGARSLDDFAKAFFGVNDGDWGQLTYRFEDVVATLNKVQPYDWATFLRKHLDDAPTDALAGITRGGYRLVYGEEPTALAKQQETTAKTTGLTYSIGATFDATGRITAVLWDSPVFKAGLTSGVAVLAVNGVAFDSDKLKAAVKASKDGGPIEFLYRQGDAFKTVKLDYHGGLRYARLEHIDGAPDLLSDILAPRTK
jgi:predicted metalloprotease with PDZ domain